MSKSNRNKSLRKKRREKSKANKRRNSASGLPNRRKLQKPWEAVKMKMFTVPNIFPPQVTQEERLKIIREVGEKYQKEFESKYLNLGTWFEKYDALYLLSFTNYYFLSHQEGIDPEATGSMYYYPHYQEWLQAFALSKPRYFDVVPLRDDAMNLFKEMQEVGRSVDARWLAKAPDLDNEEDYHSFHLRLGMMSSTTAIRNWAYYHQMKRVTEEMAVLIDVQFAHLYGMKASSLVEIIFNFIDDKTEEMNLHRQKLSKAFVKKNHLEIIEEYNSIFPGMEKIEGEEVNLMWEASGKNLNGVRSMLMMHSDLWLKDLYSCDVEYLKKLCKNEVLNEEALKRVMDAISIEFGELSESNPEHFILGNPVKDRPFIKCGDGKYFTGVIGLLPHISLGVLEFLIAKDKDLTKVYEKIKPTYLEDQIEQMAIKAFPNGHVYRGSKYGKDFENDIIIVIDTFAIVIEAKSGKVSDSAQRGAPNDLFETLQRLVEEPSEQALRFVDYLQKNKEIHSFPTKKGIVNVIDSTQIKYYIPIGVTFSNLGMISGNLKQLINSKVVNKNMEELCPSISFTDLQIIFELLESEPQLVHYLARRREFEAHVEYAGDEMDLLAFYIDTGFNIGDSEYENMPMNITLKSKELDPYVVGTSEGKSVPKPVLQFGKWWKDILDSASKKRTLGWIETCYILLNFDYEHQKKFEREIEKLKKRIIKGKAELPHNWGVFLTGAKRRRFAFIAYPYTDSDKETRNAILDQAMSDVEKEHQLRGVVALGQYLIKPAYPYNVIARKSATDLFDTLTLPKEEESFSDK